MPPCRPASCGAHGDVPFGRTCDFSRLLAPGPCGRGPVGGGIDQRISATCLAPPPKGLRGRHPPKLRCTAPSLAITIRRSQSLPAGATYLRSSVAPPFCPLRWKSVLAIMFGLGGWSGNLMSQITFGRLAELSRFFRFSPFWAFVRLACPIGVYPHAVGHLLVPISTYRSVAVASYMRLFALFK